MSLQVNLKLHAFPFSDNIIQELLKNISEFLFHYYSVGLVSYALKTYVKLDGQAHE